MHGFLTDLIFFIFDAPSKVGSHQDRHVGWLFRSRDLLSAKASRGIETHVRKSVVENILFVSAVLVTNSVL